nr:enhanced ethylene response protein 5 [Tanacetum cinerariifolium]
MILKYLVPVKLSIGILPKTSLLEKHNLAEYSNIVLAMRRGDLRLLRQALEEHEDRRLSRPPEARASGVQGPPETFS